MVQNFAYKQDVQVYESTLTCGSWYNIIQLENFLYKISIPD